MTAQASQQSPPSDCLFVPRTAGPGPPCRPLLQGHALRARMRIFKKLIVGSLSCSVLVCDQLT